MLLSLQKQRLRLGSSANVARGCSFGGVPPSTPASSAFRFVEPLEYDFWIGGGLAGCRTDDVGSVGVDLWWALRTGEIGDGSGVGAVTERDGGANNEDEPKLGIVFRIGGGDGVRVRPDAAGALIFPRRD